MAKRSLTVATPGEEPTTDSPDAAAAEAVSVAPSQEDANPATAAPASGVPNERDIDPSTIPYGKTVMTRQGHVCSTAPDPKRK